jgi:hypothetical protein
MLVCTMDKHQTLTHKLAWRLKLEWIKEEDASLSYVSLLLLLLLQLLVQNICLPCCFQAKMLQQKTCKLRGLGFRACQCVVYDGGDDGLTHWGYDWWALTILVVLILPFFFVRYCGAFLCNLIASAFFLVLLFCSLALSLYSFLESMKLNPH